MAKIKRQMRTVVMVSDGEKYTFRNGVAKVPGAFFKKKQMVITLGEFKQLEREISNG